VSAPPKGPCQPWTTPEEIKACCGTKQVRPGVVVDDLPDADLLVTAQFAGDDLYRKAGRQYAGNCPDTIRPCVGINCGLDGVLYLAGIGTGGRYGYPSIPTRFDRGWQNISCANGRCFLPCVTLPAPVTSIEEVLVDGEVLPPTSYEVFGFQKLCRTDGQLWPCGQDMTRPPTEHGTFQVTFTRGNPVDEVARRMASIYACQIVLPMLCEAGICGTDDLDGVQTITQDGVTVNFGDIEDNVFDKRRTGIGIVDRWLASVNPDGRKRPAIVGRADDPQRRGRKATGT